MAERAEPIAQETEVVYPPELTAEVPCPKCGGTGERPDKPRPGQRWAQPECSRCSGAGVIPRKHYAYCKRAACIGCLPTQAELEQNPNILDLWAEMLTWCIPQSPDTKTRDGALAALAAGRSEYETVAFFARRYHLLIESLRPMLDGCIHAFDPECARCKTMTPVRLAIEEADRR